MKKFQFLALVILAACSSPNELDPNVVVEPKKDSVTAPVEPKPEKTPSASDILIKEVMQVHDEVMPKSAVINSYMQELEKLKDEDAQASYIYGELETADEAMMTWMREVEINKKGTEEERLAYFEAEKIKIENVKTMMLNSIELAKGYLGK